MARLAVIVLAAVVLGASAVLAAVHKTAALAATPVAEIRPARCPGEARDLERRVQCGFARLPLDRAEPDGRTIDVYFELYPRRQWSRPALATVLSIEGGPGYPTAADRDARVELWRPVSDRRDLLLADLRGTGESGALGCKAFARSTTGYAARAERCARELGPDRDLYSTSQAVQDLEAILDALEIEQVDLYGDSYGSYAAQAFALRFPERLRSLTLDATYPLPGSDPAAADLVAAVRRGLELTCARSPTCPEEARADPLALVTRFAEKVRNRPLRGRAPDGDGTPTDVAVDADGLVQIASATYWHPGVWRDLQAAIAAAERGDAAPLLRLGAETITVDAGEQDPPSSSEALYLAVTCADYPQLWDPATPLDQREAEIDERLAAYPPGTFDPFTGEEWTGTDYEGWLACRRWPTTARDDPPDPDGAAYPNVPTLVLNGDLDTITSSEGAREVAERFPNSTFVEVESSVHVTAIYDHDRCASRIYLRFVRTLDAGDTSCARKIAEQRLVPAFATRLDDVAPAAPAAGDASTRADRRLAAAAAATVGDVVTRWWVNYDGTSVGLRGGRWTYEGDDPVAFDLRRVELVPGVAVTGTARWGDETGVIADVTVRAPDGTTGRLKVSWPGMVQQPEAKLTGDVGGRRLAATMPAP
jgi:pimeloyl-ACP methyl ester carboxylesterase